VRVTNPHELAELPKDKKKIVKELIDAFLFKTEMQEKLK